MRLAVMADVHANLAALEAVLEDVLTREVDRRVCLGDLVGYNAQPSECIALVREHVDDIVVGNHDLAVAERHDAPGTHKTARAVQDWTRACVSEEDRDWLSGLERRVSGEGWMGVHGCYLNQHHVEGYVTRTMVPANLEAIATNDAWPKVGFCGHTHIPITAHRRMGSVVELSVSRVRWPRDAESVLVNPGAIGQPRDGDWRASYAIVDLEARTVETIRVRYDLEATIRVMKEAGLPDPLHERLRKGV